MILVFTMSSTHNEALLIVTEQLKEEGAAVHIMLQSICRRASSMVLQSASFRVALLGNNLEVIMRNEALLSENYTKHRRETTALVMKMRKLRNLTRKKKSLLQSMSRREEDENAMDQPK